MDPPSGTKKSASSGRRLHPELVDKFPDLGLRVATVPTQVFMKGSLPSLAQRDTVLGDTCRMSATSAARR